MKQQTTSTIASIIHWPNKHGNNLVPWYVVLWRLPFWLLAQLGRVIFCVGCLGAYGWRFAVQAWRELS